MTTNELWERSSVQSQSTNSNRRSPFFIRPKINYSLLVMRKCVCRINEGRQCWKIVHSIREDSTTADRAYKEICVLIYVNVNGATTGFKFIHTRTRTNFSSVSIAYTFSQHWSYRRSFDLNDLCLWIVHCDLWNAVRVATIKNFQPNESQLTPRISFEFHKIYGILNILLSINV